MIEVEASDTLELTKIFPAHCTEYLDLLKSLGVEYYIDTETLEGSNTFLNNVLNDQFIPAGVPIIGCLTRKHDSWLERRLLYRIDKDSSSSDSLGDALAYLGKRISRLGPGDYGIQDVLTTESDGYYFLIYGIEEI